jgi:hypothetical protein
MIPTPYDKPTQPEQGLGIIERANRGTADAFEAPLGIQTGPAMDKYPLAKAAFDLTVKPASQVIDAIGRPVAAAGNALVGAAAGAAEDLGMSRTNADAFERDLRGLLQAGMITTATSPQGTQNYVPPVHAPEAIKPIHEFVKAITGGDISGNEAAMAIVKRMEQDAKYGGASAQTMIDMLNAAPTKPLTLMDVSGENVRGLAGRVARAPGEGRSLITSTLKDRDLSAGTRLNADIDRALPIGSAYDTHLALDQARRKAAEPLRNQAYAQPSVNPDKMAGNGLIGRFMRSPSMKKAVAKALSIAAEERRDPMTLGVGFDEEGNIQFVKVPSWQTLDYIKRGLDDVVEQHRNPLTKRLELDTEGKAQQQTRVEYRETLAGLNDYYKKYLDSYSGPSSSMDAMRAGQDFLSQRPEEIRRRIAELRPGDREFYKLGAADALRTRVGDKGVSADESKAIIKDRNTREKLRPLFDNDAEYDRFIASVETEQRMFGTLYDVLGNSKSAARWAEDAEKSNVASAIKAGHGAFQFATGRHVPGLRNIAEATKGWWRYWNAPDLNPKIADILSADLSGQITSGRLRTLEQALRNMPKPPKPSGQLPKPNLNALAPAGGVLWGATNGMQDQN